MTDSNPRRDIIARRAAAQLLVHRLRNDSIGVSDAILGLTDGDTTIPSAVLSIPLVELVAEHAVDQEVLLERLCGEILDRTLELAELDESGREP